MLKVTKLTETLKNTTEIMKTKSKQLSSPGQKSFLVTLPLNSWQPCLPSALVASTKC